MTGEELLQADNDALRHEMATNMIYNKEANELRAEIERLRAALQEIASGCANPMFVARAALEPKP